MRGVNKTITLGTLGADPEVKQFSNGGSITTISVAVSEKWTDKQTGQPKENTEWLRIIATTNWLKLRLGICVKAVKCISKVAYARKYQDQTGQDRFVAQKFMR